MYTYKMSLCWCQYGNNLWEYVQRKVQQYLIKMKLEITLLQHSTLKCFKNSNHIITENTERNYENIYQIYIFYYNLRYVLLEN